MSNEETIKEPQPWEQLPCESDKAYHAFLLYRDIPPQRRTLAKAARDYNNNPKTKVSYGFRKWSLEHNWDERARAWDEYRRLQYYEEIDAHRKDAVNAVWTGLNTAIQIQNEQLETMSNNERTQFINAMRRLIVPLQDGSIEPDLDVDYSDQWLEEDDEPEVV